MNKENTANIESYKKHLDEQGYVHLSGVFSKAQVKSALDEVKTLYQLYPKEKIVNIPRLDASQEVIYNLQNKSATLLKLVLDESLITQLLCLCLNDEWHRAIPLEKPNYILRSFLARNNQVATPLHIDSYIPYQGQYPLSVQVSVILEDQTVNNGATLLVPKSHQSGSYVAQSERENALSIESAAGDVVLWDSRIWHGTGQNNSGKSRWSLIATFVRWWIKQGYQITDQLPQAIYEQLSDEQKAVMGFCSEPFADEFEGIDFKVGYDSLPSEIVKSGRKKT